MLGIQPGGTPISPPPMTPRTLSDVGFDNNLDSPHHSDKLRKHHSFRLSFKRKDGRREHRDSLNGPVPAKFIRATSIKSHTLSPKWQEKFKLYVYNIDLVIQWLYVLVRFGRFLFAVFCVATSLVLSSLFLIYYIHMYNAMYVYGTTFFFLQQCVCVAMLSHLLS